jgi:hypothetical protein
MLRIIRPEILLSGISEYIRQTWGIQIDPDELDLRWCDMTGDTFALLMTPPSSSSLLSIGLLGGVNKMMVLYFV